MRGLTLIELIIVVTIVAILAAVGIGSYMGGYRKSVLGTTADQMQQALRLARQRAVAQQEGLGWGVHFENSTSTTPWYSIYKGSPYSSANVTEYYSLPSQVRYINPSAGASLDVEFAKRTGRAGAATSTIIIELSPEGTRRTISVSPAGVIDIE